MAASKKIISLFSGAMGLDLGLEGAGFKTAVAVETNKFAVATIKSNKKKLPVIDRPIESVTSKELLTKAKLKVSEVCIVSGGPCCQSFSTAGKRGSLGDSRGGLFREFTRVVKETRPRFFLMENVKGILSAAVKHRTLNDRGPENPPLERDEELGSALRVILKELGELGYYVIYGLLNCADYGVPQTRRRVIFIGSRDGEEIYLPKPTHAENPTNGQPSWVTLRETIGGLRGSNRAVISFPERDARLLGMLKEGQNWSDLPLEFQEAALGAAFKSWGGRSGFCRRLRWDRPAPTLTTSPVGRATTLCHPTKLRPLTTREYAVLQQFPPDWKFEGSASQKYIQIGNAVPTGLGKAIGMMLRDVMKQTAGKGLPRNASKRKGLVVCADPILEKSIKKQPRTQLHPPRLLKNSDPAKIRQWLQAVPAQKLLFERD